MTACTKQEGLIVTYFSNCSDYRLRITILNFIYFLHAIYRSKELRHSMTLIIKLKCLLSDKGMKTQYNKYEHVNALKNEFVSIFKQKLSSMKQICDLYLSLTARTMLLTPAFLMMSFTLDSVYPATFSPLIWRICWKKFVSK